MSRKILFLFVALLLPPLVFLFLKQFGKNQFGIPVFYTASADSLNSICQTHYASPFTVPDSSLKRVDWKKKKATLLVFGSAPGTGLNRIADTFDDQDFQLIEVQQKIKTPSYSMLARCVFFIQPPKNVVLIDHQKQIRGYYQSASREEMDRLIVELKILLKQY